MFSLLGQSIAVVEDHPATAEVVHEILNDEGIETHIYPVLNQEMLESSFRGIKEAGDSVTLIDLSLGSASGWDLVDMLNSDPQTRRIWKIVMSGEVYGTKERLARQHHADEIIGKSDLEEVSKPFDIPDLLAAIQHGLDRVDQLTSDPTTGIPGVEKTSSVMQHVFALKEPWVCLSLDWNGYGGLIEVAGPDVAEQTLRITLQRYQDTLSRLEEPRYRFLGQLGKSDGSIVICRAQNATLIGQELVSSFQEEIQRAYLSIKGGRAIWDRGFALREMIEVGRNAEEVKIPKKIPNTTLSIGGNSSLWLRGKLSFAYDDPEAWKFEPLLEAPRLMFYPRMVRRLADKARLEAEILAKGAQRTWVVMHNTNPWLELSAKEQQEYRQTHPRKKIRNGVEVDEYEEV